MSDDWFFHKLRIGAQSLAVEQCLTPEQTGEKRQWYVLLPWHEYHNLSSEPIFFGADIYPERLTSRAISHLDRIYGPTDMDGIESLIAAFRDLCSADWEANQSADDREKNSLLAAKSKEIINSYESYPPKSD